MMRPEDQINLFVREALAAGQSKAQISQALQAAGWPQNDIDKGLSAWADSDFPIPVPRPRPSVSAFEAFFYLLMFVALGMTAWHLTSLSFEIVDRLVPDPLDDGVTQYQTRSIRWSIAALIVFAPLFLVLNARSVRATRDDPSKKASPVRSWLTYLAMFFAAMALLGDLLWLIYSLLDGSLSLQVGIKAVILALIAGGILFYFRSETAEDGDAA